MALISCPECEKPVSTHAPACPHCGMPLSKSPSAEVSSSRSQTASHPLGGTTWKVEGIDPKDGECFYHFDEAGSLWVVGTDGTQRSGSWKQNGRSVDATYGRIGPWGPEDWILEGTIAESGDRMVVVSGLAGYAGRSRLVLLRDS
jgi:hypothetical protein